MDDLNYLLHREQTELLFAAHAANGERKAAHMDVARAFSVRIASHALPYRTPSSTGAVRFNPGSFGVARKPKLSLFKRTVS